MCHLPAALEQLHRDTAAAHRHCFAAVPQLLNSCLLKLCWRCPSLTCVPTAVLQQPIGKMEPQEISNICWAIGKQFLTDEKDTVWRLCNAALAMGLSQFPGQGISNISWTLARLSLQHHEFLEVGGAAGTVAGSGGV